MLLPLSPEIGDKVGICDYVHNSSNNNITVQRNGNKIFGAEENLTINVDGTGITLVYTGASRGWEVVGEIPKSNNVGTGDSEIPTNEMIRSQNWNMDDNTYLAIDQVKARDSDGLKLTDDSGNGLTVEDGGNLVADGTIKATNFEVNDVYGIR